DDAQERRLATAGRADERDELALADGQVDIRKRAYRTVIGLEGQPEFFGRDDVCSVFCHFRLLTILPTDSKCRPANAPAHATVDMFNSAPDRRSLVLEFRPCPYH